MTERKIVTQISNFISANFVYFVAVLAVLAAAVLIISARLKKEKKRESRRALSYIAGLNELIAGNNKNALDLFRDAVRYDTDNIDAYLKLGMLYRMEGNPAQAYKIHKELTIRRGLSKQILVENYRNMIIDLLELANFDEALGICEKMLLTDPKNKWALEIQPVIFEKKKDWKNAYKYLKSNAPKSQDINRKLALYKIANGKMLMNIGEYHDARLLFKEAIKLDNSYPPPYLYLGDAYAKENRSEDAVKVWREFAETVPQKSYLVYDYLDKAYFESGNYGAMEVFYSRIIEKDPDNYIALLELGEIYFKKGENDKALEMTERSLKINPKSPEGMKNLIMYLNNTSDIQVIKDKAVSLAKMITEPTTFICNNCGHKSTDIIVQCPSCEELDVIDY
jgi:lipopolysaccharide biosynthesis regulator YciM